MSIESLPIAAMETMLMLFLLPTILAGVAGRIQETPATNLSCPTSYRCGDTVDIRYPFWVDTSTGGADNATHCGYSSLRLECRRGNPVLLLPSGDYAVMGITYGDNNSAGDRTITVSDLGISRNSSCPLVTGRNLTLPAGSPPPLSLTQRDSNVTFLVNCSFRGATEWLVPCLETSDGHHTFAFPEVALSVAYSIANMCDAVVGLPVVNSAVDGLMPALMKGFELRWRPAVGGDCGDCEKAGGFCSVKHGEADQASTFNCFSGAATPEAASKHSVDTGFAIVIGVLVFLVVALLCALFCRWIRRTRLAAEQEGIQLTPIVSHRLPAITAR